MLTVLKFNHRCNLFWGIKLGCVALSLAFGGGGWGPLPMLNFGS